MVLGIVGGLMMSGLLLGAFSGSVWFVIGFGGAGLLIAGIYTSAAKYQSAASASCKAEYPSYKY